jgi:diadenosine tetraphosphate (Ap4A) HIT family hydrolase
MIYIIAFFTFMAGLFVGGLLLRGSRPGSLLCINECSRRLHPNEVAGLFASVVVQKIPGVIPNVILETDKTIVFKHPRSRHRIHYMFVPKKDIKNIGELTDEDKEYIIDLYSTVVAVINREGIRDYTLLTRGPGLQDVAYLHFHLTAG